ncbi:MAG: hypothetical protein VCA17_09355, partial [Dehalococcoidia bacterium]
SQMVSESQRYAPADRKLFIFDLALPRDVEPSVAHIPNVELFNIDDLWSIAEDNMNDRHGPRFKPRRSSRKKSSGSCDGGNLWTLSRWCAN